jgi:hypothetical protein
LESIANWLYKSFSLDAEQHDLLVMATMNRSQTHFWEEICENLQEEDEGDEVTEGVKAESVQSDEEQVEQGGEEDGEAHFEAAN